MSLLSLLLLLAHYVEEHGCMVVRCSQINCGSGRFCVRPLLFPLQRSKASNIGAIQQERIAVMGMVWYGIVEFNVPLDTV